MTNIKQHNIFYKLLSDPDETAYLEFQSQIRNNPKKYVPYLLNIQKKIDNNVVKSRIRNTLLQIYIDKEDINFKKYVNAKNMNFFKVYVNIQMNLLADEYADNYVEIIYDSTLTMQKMTKIVWQFLNPKYSHLAGLRAINQYLLQIEKIEVLYPLPYHPLNDVFHFSIQTFTHQQKTNIWNYLFNFCTIAQNAKIKIKIYKDKLDWSHPKYYLYADSNNKKVFSLYDVLNDNYLFVENLDSVVLVDAKNFVKHYLDEIINCITTTEKTKQAMQKLYNDIL